MSYGLYDGSEVIAELVAPLKVVPKEPMFISDSLSLGRTVTRRSNQRWEIETRLMPMAGGNERLFAFLLDHGIHTSFTVITPQPTGAKLKRTATSAITATGVVGSTTVTLAGSNGLVPAGTFIKFANHGKVYATKSSRDGDGTINIYPELRMAVAGVAMSYQDDVQMQCKFNDETILGMAFEDGWLMDIGVVKLLENV